MSKRDKAYKAARELGGNLGAQAKMALDRGGDDPPLLFGTASKLLKSDDPRAREILDGLAGDK